MESHNYLVVCSKGINENDFAMEFHDNIEHGRKATIFWENVLKRQDSSFTCSMLNREEED